MSDNYNGRPYKVGFLQNFKQMPPSLMTEMVQDLGLKMPIAHLTTYRNLFNKNDYRYTIDELYMADTLYEEMNGTDFPYSISTFTAENDSVREAFADLMEKRQAMCDNMPVTLGSLVSDYNAYLCEHGYDNGDSEKFTVVPLKNTDSAASTMKYRTIGSFMTHDSAPYAIARISKPSRFNTDKSRVIMGHYSTAALSVILVKLPESPLMYELLSDVINAIPHLSNNITYLTPIASKGLIRVLAELGCGFSLNLDQVMKIFPEADRPYLLAKPMSAVAIVAPPLAAGAVMTELRGVNFDCELIGTSSAFDHLISVSYGGFSHSVDLNAMKNVIFTRTLHIFAKERETVCSFEVEDGIAINVFDGSSFEQIYATLSSSVAALKGANAGCRLTAYVCIPFSSKMANEEFCAFLAVYRALAEDAIPIRMLTTFENRENNRLCVFIADENHVVSRSEQ